MTVTVHFIAAEPGQPFAADELRSWIGNHGPQLTAAGITTCTVLDAEISTDGLHARITIRTDDNPSHSQLTDSATTQESS